MTAYYNEIDPYAAEWIRAASDGVYSSGYATRQGNNNWRIP